MRGVAGNSSEGAPTVHGLEFGWTDGALLLQGSMGSSENEDKMKEIVCLIPDSWFLFHKQNV